VSGPQYQRFGRATFKSSEATGQVIIYFTLKLFDAAIRDVDTALLLARVFLWRHPSALRREIEKLAEKYLPEEQRAAEERVHAIYDKMIATEPRPNVKARLEAEKRAKLMEARKTAELAALVKAMSDVHARYGFAWVTRESLSISESLPSLPT